MMMQNEEVNKLAVKKQLLMKAYEDGELEYPEYVEEMNDTNNKIKELLMKDKKEIIVSKEEKKEDNETIKILEALTRIEAELKEIRLIFKKDSRIDKKSSTEIYFEVLKSDKYKTFQEYVGGVLEKMPYESIPKLSAKLRTFLYNISKGKVTKYSGYVFDSKTFTLALK